MTVPRPTRPGSDRTADAETLLVDTHVHFWDHSLDGFRWPWLEPGFTHRKLRDTHTLDAPRYTAREYRSEVARSGVGGVVHVQAAGPMADPARESEWLQGMADDTGWPNAVIGSGPLADPDAAELLRRHARWARVRGIRDIAASRRLLVEEVAPALDCAAELGFSVEVRVPVDRFRVLGELADRWPQITFVLSHAGLPEQRGADDLAAWSGAVLELAARPNWVCKISAVAGASDPDWTVDSIRPWVAGCLAAFGTERCMFGTNWPVDRLFGRHEDLVRAYDQLTDHLDPAARADVFHRTATRVYRIPADELGAEQRKGQQGRDSST